MGLMTAAVPGAAVSPAEAAASVAESGAAAVDSSLIVVTLSAGGFCFLDAVLSPETRPRLREAATGAGFIVDDKGMGCGWWVGYDSLCTERR